METEQTRALVERFHSTWAANDGEALAGLMADNVVQQYPPYEKTRNGPGEVIEYFIPGEGSAADSILKIDTMERTVHTLVVEGPLAVAFLTVRAELHNGNPYRNEYMYRYTCADGKIARIDGMVDRLHIMNQIGDHEVLHGTAED